MHLGRPHMSLKINTAEERNRRPRLAAKICVAPSAIANMVSANAINVLVDILCTSDYLGNNRDHQIYDAIP